MTVTDPAQKPLADRAVGELAYMLAKVGRVSELGALLQSLEARPARSAVPSAQKIAGAPGWPGGDADSARVSFRSGPLALHRIMLALHPENPRRPDRRLRVHPARFLAAWRGG
jgi:hypothetical protein